MNGSTEEEESPIINQRRKNSKNTSLKNLEQLNTEKHLNYNTLLNFNENFEDLSNKFSNSNFLDKIVEPLQNNFTCNHQENIIDIDKLQTQQREHQQERKNRQSCNNKNTHDIRHHNSNHNCLQHQQKQENSKNHNNHQSDLRSSLNVNYFSVGHSEIDSRSITDSEDWSISAIELDIKLKEEDETSLEDQESRDQLTQFDQFLLQSRKDIIKTETSRLPTQRQVDKSNQQIFELQSDSATVPKILKKNLNIADTENQDIKGLIKQQHDSNFETEHNNTQEDLSHNFQIKLIENTRSLAGSNSLNSNSKIQINTESTESTVALNQNVVKKIQENQTSQHKIQLVKTEKFDVVDESVSQPEKTSIKKSSSLTRGNAILTKSNLELPVKLDLNQQQIKKERNKIGNINRYHLKFINELSNIYSTDWCFLASKRPIPNF